MNSSIYKESMSSPQVLGYKRSLMLATNLPRTENAAPPPPVVLGRELEVGEGYGDTGGHTEENAVDNKEDTVQGVLLPAPQRGEDVIQLHRDSTDRKESW